MKEQQPRLIEEPEPTGKDPETCGTCRYQSKEERCHRKQAQRIEAVYPSPLWEHPPADSGWPGCEGYVHRETRRGGL